MSLSETQEQIEIVAWFRKRYPIVAPCVRLSQTGGHRGKGKLAAIRNAREKAMGRVDGESDLAFLIPRGGYGSMVLEHKSLEDKKGPTDDQIAYINFHRSIGNYAKVSKGIEQAKAFIEHYMGMGPR